MITFRVPDMTCGHCASTIARAIAGVDKDARLEVSIPQKLVKVHSTASEGELAEAIRDAGYPTEMVGMPAPVPTTADGGGCCCSAKRTADSAMQAAPARRSSCCG